MTMEHDGVLEEVERELGPFSEDAVHAEHLQKMVQESAGITLELQDKGPLYKYAMQRRDDAMAAMRELVRLDPQTEAFEIVRAQSVVREYVRVCDWLRVSLEEGTAAEQQLMEEYEQDGTRTSYSD